MPLGWCGLPCRGFVEPTQGCCSSVQFRDCCSACVNWIIRVRHSMPVCLSHQQRRRQRKRQRQRRRPRKRRKPEKQNAENKKIHSVFTGREAWQVGGRGPGWEARWQVIYRDIDAALGSSEMKHCKGCTTKRSSTECHGAARVTRVSLWNVAENSRVVGTRYAGVSSSVVEHRGWLARVTRMSLWNVAETSRVTGTCDAGVFRSVVGNSTMGKYYNDLVHRH